MRRAGGPRTSSYSTGTGERVASAPTAANRPRCSAAGCRPRASSRRSSSAALELVEDRVELGCVEPVAGHPQRELRGDEPLLGAVVEVALEPLALGVGGGDQAGARLEQPLARVGARERQRRRAGRTRSAAPRRRAGSCSPPNAASTSAPQTASSTITGAAALSRSPRQVLARALVLVEAGGQAGVAHERQRAAAARARTPCRRGTRDRAPAAGDLRAGVGEAHDRRRAHAADARGLLGDRREHLAGVAAARDEHGDLAQGGLDQRGRSRPMNGLSPNQWEKPRTRCSRPFERDRAPAQGGGEGHVAHVDRRPVQRGRCAR